MIGVGASIAIVTTLGNRLEKGEERKLEMRN